MRIADALLDQELAACIQIVPIESCYRWQGKIENAAELLLLIKTKAALFDAAIEAIRKIHPYETPEIVATQFTAGLSDYFGWVESVTK